jgi:hypothetical protein
MSQLYRRIHRLEIHIGLVGRGSLDALFQELPRMGRSTSVSFQDAIAELVKGLDAQELNSIIMEVESRFGEISLLGPRGNGNGIDATRPRPIFAGQAGA